jgi:hypothetical protein
VAHNRGSFIFPLYQALPNPSLVFNNPSHRSTPVPHVKTVRYLCLESLKNSREVLNMTPERHFSRQALAQRWNTSTRTIDRLRQAGKLPWIDIAGGRGARPIVRFTLTDVEQYERAMRQNADEFIAGKPAAPGASTGCVHGEQP